VVLQVLPALNAGGGGVERSAVDVAAAIVEAGGTALVASEGGALERELKRAGAEHITLPLATKSPLRIRRNAWRLAALVRDRRVDIVHARSRAPAWSAWLAARRTGCHFVTTFHGTYGHATALKRAYNSVMLRGERVIANSEFIAEHIRKTYRVDPERLRVIQRGVDVDRFDPGHVSAERVIQLANRWRLPDGVPVVMLPGRLTRWKGQGILIDAVAQLGDVDLVCILVGGDQGRTGYRRELEIKIARLGLNGRVWLMDACDDMPAAYKLADVVVNASTEPEAFGRVVGEAQAMGRPVVAGNHGGVPEQVIANHTAFLVEPGDPASFAEGIRRALALNTYERDRLAREAIEHAQRYFSKERMCNRTLAVYQELLRSDAYSRIPVAENDGVGQPAGSLTEG
jgi:glycosyltransferase involved in cell wall biosynthesis